MKDLLLHQIEGVLVRKMSRYSATSSTFVGNSPAQMEELTICIAVLETCRYVKVCMVYTYVLQYVIWYAVYYARGTW